MNPSIVLEFYEKKCVKYDLEKRAFANFQKQKQHCME